MDEWALSVTSLSASHSVAVDPNIMARVYVDVLLHRPVVVRVLYWMLDGRTALGCGKALLAASTVCVMWKRVILCNPEWRRLVFEYLLSESDNAWSSVTRDDHIYAHTPLSNHATYNNLIIAVKSPFTALQKQLDLESPAHVASAIISGLNISKLRGIAATKFGLRFGDSS